MNIMGDDGILGQDPVRCKIVVDNKYLQQVKNLKYLGCGSYYENKNLFKEKTIKMFSNIGNSKQHF
jgi:hypothetical protein